MTEKALELSKKYKTLLSKYGVNTNLRLAHFFAQCAHESGLKPVQENLFYSAKGLMTTFKKYFPTLESTVGFVKKPEKIANKVYANRMANGNEASGDGWKYSGKGFIQITGKTNYEALSNYTKVDYVSAPELLLNEADSMISALWYWNTADLNKFADKDDILTITKRINGGTNGLEHRTQLLKDMKKVFK